MAYSQGSIISASDYNELVAGTNKINTVWGVGSGNIGYGQSNIANVSVSSTVTATQWATLINTVNSIITHQTGTGTGMSATTAGSTINFLSTLQANITSAYTNRLNYSAGQGTTVTGTVFSPVYNDAIGNWTADTWTFTRTITFSSANAARYFFNCGGALNFVTTSVTNNNTQGRSADWVTLIGTYFGNLPSIRYTTNGGKSGTGGTITTNDTTLGYYDLNTTGNTAVLIYSATYPYAGDYVKCVLRSDAAPGAVIYADFTVYSATLNVNKQGGNALNVTWNHRFDVIPPESTNLTPNWGTPTIT